MWIKKAAETFVNYKRDKFMDDIQTGSYEGGIGGGGDIRCLNEVGARGGELGGGRDYEDGGLGKKEGNEMDLVVLKLQYQQMNRKNEKRQQPQLKNEEIDQSQPYDESEKSGKTGKGRQDNSLAVLTRKFVQLIRGEIDQTIDLNKAVDKLKVQKRRIYDITNVLEGIGYVEKLQKNMIHWMGESENLNNEREIKEYGNRLKELEEDQKQLDDEIDALNRNIKEQYLQNEKLKEQHYITYEDCLDIAKSISQHSQDKSLVVLSAPKGSILEAVQQGDGTSQLIMNSQNKGEIQVFIADPRTSSVQKYMG